MQYPMYDPAAALDRLEGDRDLLAAMFEVFRTERPKMIAGIHRAIDAGDANAVMRSAHLFKGAVGNFADVATFEHAFALEVMGDEGVLADAAHTLATLEAAVGHLEHSLSAFLSEA
jgi:histidine phosphotransfer protein HptB